MKTVTVKGGDRTSRILVGESLANLARYCPANSVIVTDERVGGLYGSIFPPFPVITIGQGEEEKTVRTVESIWERLLDLGADRSSFLVGIGGGIVCDVTGFAASTFMRGLPFGFAASTLLAQVDASVGGKNGVNFKGYKNMAGVFAQPEFVICDPALLNTLPPEEIQNGMAEIVKHGAISDADYFRFIEENADKALDLDPDVIESLVGRSVEIKAAVVTADEREAGERRKLNFGHTIGHAFEKVLKVSHGRAVSAGMAAAAALSVRRGLIPQEEAARLPCLLERLGLPVAFSAEPGSIEDALAKDKKKEGGVIHLVLLEAIGRARIEAVPVSELSAEIAALGLF